MMHPYSLAILYHAHHSRHLEDIPFWRELARRNGNPILELGCGTGRVTMALAKDGLHVIGLDINANMLSILRKRTSSGIPKLSILQADMTNFHLALPFALIIMPCNTYSTLSRNNREASLRSACRHLLPSGTFAVSLPNPMVLETLPRKSEPQLEETFLHPQSGNPVQVSSSWRRSAHDFTLLWTYDHLLPDGRVERFTSQVRHHLASVETLLDEFHQAGLHINGLYGDYDWSDIKPDSPQMIICAETKKF